ncbi:hypothetical protein [Mesorhizobium sp. WSM2239]|uniref:Uracil-DNA glycosylase-like domain-containing protein n=2 Tax=unclassified Mesorhizobium TaxID=325217 RepID=A0AAU8D7K9_9HYPH
MTDKTILFLGLCAKKNAKGGLHAPLAPTSRSGRFLTSLLADLPLNRISITRDNIIPGPVEGPDGDERNPTWAELLPWLRKHRLWQNSSLAAVVVFGGEAKRAFEVLQAERPTRTPIYFFQHPSYALRQPASRRDAYARELSLAVAMTEIA